MVKANGKFNLYLPQAISMFIKQCIENGRP